MNGAAWRGPRRRGGGVTLRFRAARIYRKLGTASPGTPVQYRACGPKLGSSSPGGSVSSGGDPANTWARAFRCGAARQQAEAPVLGVTAVEGSRETLAHLDPRPEVRRRCLQPDTTEVCTSDRAPYREIRRHLPAPGWKFDKGRRSGKFDGRFRNS